MNQTKIFKNKSFIELIQFTTNFNKIAIAFSGGADSLALSLLLMEYISKFCHNKTFAITLLSINHNLRSETKQEIEFIKKFSQKLNLPHQIFNLDFTKHTKNLHDQAHKMRYQVMLNWCWQNNFPCLLSAHQQNDQLETFLMRASKGMGLDGLCAIKPIQIKQNIHIIRPLIDISRTEILNYLSLKNQIYIQDRSNENQNYTRAFIRKQINNLHPKLKNELLHNINQTTTKLHSSKDALHFYIKQNLDNYTEIQEHKAILNLEIFNLNTPLEIIIQVLKEIFIKFAGKQQMRIYYTELKEISQKLSHYHQNPPHSKPVWIGQFYGCELHYQNHAIIFSKI